MKEKTELKTSPVKYLIEVSASMRDVNLFYSYKTIGFILYGIAADVINKNNGHSNEWSTDYVIISFYLLRHALELGMKAVLEIGCSEGKKVRGHDIKKLWKKIEKSETRNISLSYKDKINKALIMLKKYGVLQEEQLFRYHTNIKKDKKIIKKIEELPDITNIELEILDAAVDVLHSLHQQHYKKSHAY